jgi:hypothetical protein
LLVHWCKPKRVYGGSSLELENVARPAATTYPVAAAAAAIPAAAAATALALFLASIRAAQASITANVLGTLGPLLNACAVARQAARGRCAAARRIAVECAAALAHCAAAAAAARKIPAAAAAAGGHQVLASPSNS